MVKSPGKQDHLRYEVVIVGFRLNADEGPAKVLERVLGLDAQRAKALSQRFPAVVGAGSSLAQVQAVARRLVEAGAKVEVREQQPAAAPAAQLAPSQRAQAPAPARASSVARATGSARVSVPPTVAAAPVDDPGYSLGDLMLSNKAESTPAAWAGASAPEPRAPRPQGAAAETKRAAPPAALRRRPDDRRLVQRYAELRQWF